MTTTDSPLANPMLLALRTALVACLRQVKQASKASSGIVR